jgi:hypothetical protein
MQRIEVCPKFPDDREGPIHWKFPFNGCRIGMSIETDWISIRHLQMPLTNVEIEGLVSYIPRFVLNFVKIYQRPVNAICEQLSRSNDSK